MLSSRDGNGGAREARCLDCAFRGRKTDTTKTCPQASWLGVNDVGTIKASGTSPLLSPVVDLSLAAGFTRRFDELDSSISCPNACKSSVAETTGNSNVRTQLRSRQDRTRSKRRQPCANTDSRRHNHRAGSASVSQNRLSNNSMVRQNNGSSNKGSSEQSLANYWMQVNAIARACTLVRTGSVLTPQTASSPPSSRSAMPDSFSSDTPAPAS